MGTRKGQKKYKWLQGPDGLHKICSVCGIDKPADEYVRTTSSRSGRTAECKLCHGLQSLRYYAHLGRTPRGKRDLVQNAEYVRSYEIQIALHWAERVGGVLILPTEERT